MRARAWLAPALAATTACAAGSAGGRPPCGVGLALVDGACLGPKETDDYCGGRSVAIDGSGSCVVPACAPGEAVDPVTSTCVARRTVAALGAGGERGRGLGDEAILGCGEGRVLAAHHDHVECLAREQVCPPTARWDMARGCVTDAPCKAGEVRVRSGRDAGACRPLLNGAVVDVGAWTRTTVEDQLCRRLRRTPWEFTDPARGGAGRVSLDLDLVFPDNDVAGASATAHFDPPVPSEAAQASAQGAIEALLIPLRALGGTADAASVTLRVTCPMDRGAAPRLLLPAGGAGGAGGAGREGGAGDAGGAASARD
jgi:hypothetical protein